MMSKNLIGICEEPTTYRHEFRPLAIQRVAPKNREHEKISRPTKKIPLFAESYDTLQKLDYQTRLPFDALWQTKEIVGTNFPKSFNEKAPTKEVAQVSRSKPTEVVSPAVSLNDVKDSEVLKRIVDYTYKTTMSSANEEVWGDLKKTDDQLPNVTCEDSENLISVRPQLIPDLPAGFKGAAKKWDFLQDRRLVDNNNLSRREFCAPCSTGANEYLLRNPEMALNNKKLSLPYEKLPSSYGGHRTPIALGVNLERRKKSMQHPDLSVSQILALRRCQDFTS